ncbi:MAG TPA: VOC family protein, partial [Pyrinomonadaceae bacterium]|nr:VOC family protein [Pyrinomonadaceae bacterium]
MITSIVPKLPFINKEETLDFYLNRLGFKLGSDYGDYFIVFADNAEIHFFSYPDLEPSKSDFMVYLRVENGIDELYSKYSSCTKIIGKLEAKHWRQKEFALTDPNGTLLTF